MHNLDFIGLAERIEESYAVLGLLLKVPPSDLVFLSPSKLSGSYLPKPRRKKSCYLLEKAVVTDHVKEYLDSDAWKKRNRYNNALYEAANASLDATIDSIGHNVFDRYLSQYRAVKELASQKCKPFSYCSADGEYLKKEDRCTNGEMGCGETCLDKLFANASATF